MRRLTNRFSARDAGGKVYTIFVYTTSTSSPVLNGPSMDIPGQNEFELTDGSLVYQMGEGQYEIAATGVILRSDAPDAP